MLCHPGVRRLSHYVRQKNLPFSVEDVKNVCRNCVHCLEQKPRFIKRINNSLIRATRPFERISIDFMGPKPSTSKNQYILSVIDEYSRFPFAFPCPDTSAETVIRCLKQLFTLCGTPESLHSDRGSHFMATSVQQFLRNRNIAQTRTSPYNPAGNGQCERLNGTLWKAILLTSKSQNLKESQWEQVLPDALHSLRSLLCTATNSTPHERFFLFHRHSTLGSSIPTWLFESKFVLIKRHVRQCKSDPLVDRVEVFMLTQTMSLFAFPVGKNRLFRLQMLLRGRPPRLKPMAKNISFAPREIHQENIDQVNELEENIDQVDERKDSSQRSENIDQVNGLEELPRRSDRFRCAPDRFY